MPAEKPQTRPDDGFPHPRRTDARIARLAALQFGVVAKEQLLRLALPDLVARYPGRRGVRTIRALLERGGLGLHVTRSELERRFVDLVAAAGLPAPVVNALVEGFVC